MKNNRHRRPYDEESLEEHARNIVGNIPMLPVLHDEFSIDTLESAVSELSFSTDTSSSDSTTIDAQNTKEPIVELPSTPPREPVEVRTRFLSLDRTITPETIGEALERSGTVLMQRSRENRMAKQLVEMQALIGYEDELIVLKKPSTVRQEQSQPAFTQEMMRSFLEHSETMFNLVHDTHGESSVKDEVSMKEISKKVPSGSGANVEKEEEPTDEFVGCFSKNDHMVLYKRTVKERSQEEQRRESIDTLIAQHAQCLVEADEVTQPSVQIYRKNDEAVLALLTFSDQSSAMLKTPKATVDDANSYEDLNKVLLQTYRQLLTRPDEMISMQTQRVTAGRETRHTDEPRSADLRTRSTGSASFGLTNDSQRSGVALERSSKNWMQCPNARNAAEIVLNLRLMLEEFILRELPPSKSVLKFLARLLTDIANSPPAEVGEEFQRAPLISKIKCVVDELLMPHELEDPLRIVNHAKLTLAQVVAHRIHLRTVCDAADAWARVLATSGKLVCELDHDIADPDAFIEAIQFGLRSIFGLEIAEQLFARSLETFSDVETSNRQELANVANESHPPQSPVVCNCLTSWALLLFCSTTVWLKEQLGNFWHFLITTPPILAGPSVSFRETVTDDEAVVQELRVQNEQMMDVLRVVLEKSPSLPRSSPAGAQQAASVDVRSLDLFAQLLQSAGHIELRHSNSRHNIHLQLRESVSGDLQKRQSDDLLMLAGNIRDRVGNVTVCFEARMFDPNRPPQDESAVEYVTRVERLSDDRDDCAPADNDTNDQELMINTVVEEIASLDRLENSYQRQPRTIVDSVPEEVKHCLQDLLEPVATAVRAIERRMVDITGHVSSTRLDAVKRAEGENETPQKSIQAEDGPCIDPTDGSSFSEPFLSTGVCKSRSTMDFPLVESLQELVSMFHDANDRLAIIDCDVTTIRNQVQQLVAEQLRQLQLLQQQQDQKNASKPSHGDGQYPKPRKASNKAPRSQRQLSNVVEDTIRCGTLVCPIERKLLLSSTNPYSPVEVYSCHGVAPDVLVVHWIVDDDVIDCISGYEVHVDGVLRSVCFSNKRRTALIAKINLRQEHQLMVHATPHNRLEDSVQWAPAYFVYHL